MIGGYIIKVVGTAGVDHEAILTGRPAPHGMFLRAYGDDGVPTFCVSRDDAQRFDSMQAAYDCAYREYPQGVGGHNPGGPNRPLTAFTLTVEPFSPSHFKRTIDGRDVPGGPDDPLVMGLDR